MPRYYFDVDDGERKVRDVIGMNLGIDDLAMKEGSTLLQTLSNLRQAEDRPGTTYVRVLDTHGHQVFTGSAHLEG